MMSLNVDGFVAKYCLSSFAATVAETATFPLDITKTRLQIQGEGSRNQVAYRGMLRTAFGIAKEEGFVKLWQGLPPAVLRHLVYSGSRMGFYEYLRDVVMKKNEDGYFPVWKSIVAGMSAGGFAQFLASPTDLVKVQMQMQGKRALEGHPALYKNTFHAFRLIARNHGLQGLWKGWLPNVQRAALVNLGDLTTYDTAKHFFLRRFSLQDNWVTHGLSSICSGLFASILGTPADVIKTRIMNNPSLYKGSLDCFVKSIRHEGFFSLYKGFLPTWARMHGITLIFRFRISCVRYLFEVAAPWSLTFWLSYEQIRRMFGIKIF